LKTNGRISIGKQMEIRSFGKQPSFELFRRSGGKDAIFSVLKTYDALLEVPSFRKNTHRMIQSMAIS